VVLFPSFLYLTDVLNSNSGEYVQVGAQNCSAFENGAYTGEVSANQLSSTGVSYVIIGHSERREYFAETNEVLKEKVKLALSKELIPVFCCGEPLKVRNENKQQEYVLKQLEESLFNLTAEEISKVIIAYEPIWAIGTGLNATAAQAQEMHSFIRRQLALKYSEKLASTVRILYGGSCKPDNAKELFSCADVDGGLIGGASLKANDFLAIIEAAK
jgi:triosephosphate isomerase